MNIRQYEALIITAPAADAALQQSGAKPVFEQLCDKAGGKVTGRHDLGRRLLGYEVRKGAREGNVTSYDFELAPDQSQALRRILELSEDILKFMVTVKSKAKKTTAALNVPNSNVPAEAKK